MKLSFFAAIFFSIALTTVGCKDCAPVPDPGTDMILSFHDSTGEKVDTAFFSISGLGNDSTIYPTATDSILSTYFLPVNLRTARTSYVFITQDTAGNEFSDTLEISYDVSAVINQPDCDLFEQVDNLQIVSSTFDSVLLVTSIIEPSDSSNIKVFIN